MAATYQTYNHSARAQAVRSHQRRSPVGSRGGAIVRHRFPLDAEYEISVTLTRDRLDEVIGMTEERKLDLRLDDERLSLFTIASMEREKAGLGAGTAPDAHLKTRLPVKAGTHEIAATFLKDTTLQEGVIERVRDDQVRVHFDGVATITVFRPIQGAGTGRDAEPREDFICRPARGEEEACAQKILSNLAHRAYRRQATRVS